jgi:hypothetical protein
MALKRNFGWVRLLVLSPFFLEAAALNADSGNGVLVDDATVYENETGNNGGGGSEICIGNVGATTNTRRAFVRYTLPAIPAGSTIDRVVLAIFQDRVRDLGAGPLAATLSIRQVTADWVEGTGSGPGSGPCGGGADVAGVDWAAQPTVAGAGSASAALSANDNVNVVLDTDIGTASDGLIADVQSWVDTGAANFGWRLAAAEEATADNARALVPGTLTVHWTPPPVEQLIFRDGFESP